MVIITRSLDIPLGAARMLRAGLELDEEGQMLGLTLATGHGQGREFIPDGGRLDLPIAAAPQIRNALYRLLEDKD